MSTNLVLSSWDDLVFQNRNKSYGAYFLRKIYGRNVIVAAAVAIALLLLVLAYPTIAEWFKGTEEVQVTTRTKVQTQLMEPPSLQPDKLPPPNVPPPPTKTIVKFLPPKVTEKEVVEEKMPEIQELKKVEVGAENIKGTDTEVVFTEPVKEVTGDGDSNKIFTIVEQPAEPVGGMAAFYQWVSKNLHYPAAARRMGLEGKVFVKFVIEINGSLSNVEVVRGLSGECDNEAIRVLSKAPAWKPAKQSGRNVRQVYILPITFKLAE